jgi:TonB family protein
VEVENASGWTLECDTTLDLDGVDADGQSQLRRRGVVLPHQKRAMLQALLPPATTVKSVNAQCAARALLPPVETPAECRVQIVRTVNLRDYYPAASQRLIEEGPVALQYTLASAEASPTDIRVVGSSLSERLDAAAVRALGDMGMTTSCPGRQFRLQVVFKLRD